MSDPEEQNTDFAPGELNRLLAQGEQSGELLDGDDVLAELRKLRRLARIVGEAAQDETRGRPT